ncbi:unnamed protein product [Auanema sp. JU1783]|nr:unnamed protein product [Auanema sp. JU1783]
MGWYTHVYIFIRELKKSKPILGQILSISLNLTLVIQVFFILLSVYIYGEHIAGHFIRNSIQSTFYMMIYLSLVSMTALCLLVTVLTPVARVPQTYRVSDVNDKQLKSLTAQIDGKFVREKSSKENIQKQVALLDMLANERKLIMVEGSRCGGYKYCYDCQHLKPDRSKHCRSCGHCVLRYDHHCPYINKCINHHNYKSFCLYIFYSCLSVVWFFLSSSECVLRFIIYSDWENDMNSMIWIISALIPVSIIGFSVYADLLFYHYYLIQNNSTTAEEASSFHMRLDVSISYDIGKEENFSQTFGWGLWFFPLWTSLEDGLHYEIKNSPLAKYQVKRVVCDKENTIH